MADQPNMSPDSSPGSVVKTGTRRVNNMPLFIIGGVAVVFLTVMVIVGMQRSAKQNAPVDAAQEKSKSTAMFAKAITADQPNGIIAPSAPVAPPLDAAASAPVGASAIAIARPNLDLPPTPPGRLNTPAYAQNNVNMTAQRDDATAERIRQAKEMQFMDAVKAAPTVQYQAPRSNASSVDLGPAMSTSTPTSRDEMLARLAAVRRQAENLGSGDPTAAYKAKLAELQGAGIVPVSAGAGSMASANSGSGMGGLLGGSSAAGTRPVASAGAITQSGDRFRLDSQPEAPTSPFELRAPSVIPATLISGINSELKGPIFAQVSQNVYDTATGRFLLIPQGSKLYGEYDSSVAYGQSRILIAWNRIVYPDGKAQDIGSMPGSDSAGYAGFNDEVNNHYFRTFASAILLSGVTAGASIATSQNQTTSIYGQQQTTSGALSQALGQQLGQVTANLIQKNMNVAPTLEIRPGYRFNVVVVKDLVFSKPYQSFDY